MQTNTHTHTQCELRMVSGRLQLSFLVINMTQTAGECCSDWSTGKPCWHWHTHLNTLTQRGVTGDKGDEREPDNGGGQKWRKRWGANRGRDNGRVGTPSVTLILRPDQLLTYFYHVFAISVGCWGFGSGGWFWAERRGWAGGAALTGVHRWLTGWGAGVVEENPLTPPPSPGVVLAEASDGWAQVEAESPWRTRRGARFGEGLAFDCKCLIPLGGAGLVDPAVCGGQQGKFWGGAFTVQQRRELPQPQVRARVRPLALQRPWWRRSQGAHMNTPCRRTLYIIFSKTNTPVNLFETNK